MHRPPALSCSPAQWPSWLRRLLWMLLLLVALAATARAQSSVEYQVKAAFVVKFGAYVEWPPQAFERPDSPLVIGVIGPEAVAEEFERAAAGQTADGHAVQVRHLARGEAPTGVHIVFVARSHNGQLGDTLAPLRGRTLLTVTETEPTVTGVTGMINFVIVDNKVRFDVALAPAEAVQLRISARLLSVARRVLKS